MTQMTFQGFQTSQIFEVMPRPITSVTKSIEIEAAHFIRNHPGKCKYLHGHSYKIDLTITADCVNEETGMLIDFGDVKSILSATVGLWDHALLVPYTSADLDHYLEYSRNDEIDLLKHFGIFEPTRIIPIGRETTAENLVWSAGTLLQKEFKNRLPNFPPFWFEVTIWETSNSSAIGTFVT